jgi:hypothetical protein
MTTLSPDETESLDEYVLATYGTDEYEIIGACPLLWSGWETDTVAVLVGLPDGRRAWGVVDAFAFRSPEGIPRMLRQRIAAYRQAILETEALLMIAGEL